MITTFAINLCFSRNKTLWALILSSGFLLCFRSSAQTLHLAGDWVQASNRTAAVYGLETTSDLTSADWRDRGYVNPGDVCSLPLNAGADQEFFRLQTASLPHAGELMVNVGFEDGVHGWQTDGDASLQISTNSFSGFRAASMERAAA